MIEKFLKLAHSQKQIDYHWKLIRGNEGDWDSIKAIVMSARQLQRDYAKLAALVDKAGFEFSHGVDGEVSTIYKQEPQVEVIKL